MTKLLVIAYIAAIAAANVLVGHYGPWVTPYTAFMLIGLDLSSRDRLQDLMKEHRRVKMLALICAGSVVAYAADPSVQKIAEASAISFAAASSVDWLVYSRLRASGRSWLARSNTANLFGAAIDSSLFPTLAFGVWLWPVVFAQFTAKIAGGLLWSVVIGETTKADKARA